jgi:hypothetical protein
MLGVFRWGSLGLNRSGTTPTEVGGKYVYSFAMDACDEFSRSKTSQFEERMPLTKKNATTDPDHEKSYFRADSFHP